MQPFIVVFIICCGLCMAYSVKKSFVLIFIITLILILTLGLREENVGIDTVQYIYNYKKAIGGSYDKSILFVLVSKLSSFLGLSITFVFLFFAFMTITPLFYVLYKEDYSIILGLLIFFSMGLYLRYFNIMIQGAAVGLYFLAFYFKLKNKNRSFIVILTLSCITHFSVILVIPFLFIGKLRNVNVHLLMIWLFSLIFVFFSDALLIFLSFLKYVLPENYKAYLSIKFVDVNASASLGDIIPQLLFILSWYVYSKVNASNHYRERAYLLMFLVGVVIMNILNYAIFFNRIHLYFTTFAILAVPFSIKFLFKDQQLYFVKSIFFVILTALFLYRLIQDPYGLIPYNISLRL